MKKFLMGMLLVLFFAGICDAAGTLTITRKKVEPAGSSRAIMVLKFTWTSDASGDVSSTTEYAQSVTGTLIGFKCEPSSTSAPTDDYDVEVNDGEGVDILNADGTDMPQSTTSSENYRTPVDFQNDAPISIVDEKLTLVVDNAGNATSGVVELYILLP